MFMQCMYITVHVFSVVFFLRRSSRNEFDSDVC